MVPTATFCPFCWHSQTKACKKGSVCTTKNAAESDPNCPQTKSAKKGALLWVNFLNRMGFSGVYISLGRYRLGAQLQEGATNGSAHMLTKASSILLTPPPPTKEITT